MYKKSLLILLLLLRAVTLAAHPLAVGIVGYPVKPYEEAIRGFESLFPSNIHPLVLSENKGVDIIDKIKRKQPDILLSVGLSALKRVSNIGDIPIIHIMVLDPFSKARLSENSTGISMNIAPAVQFDIFQKVLPDIHTIGVLYNPKNTGFLVQEALSVTKGSRLKLMSETLDKPKDIIRKLNMIKPHIDAFWMLPDMTLVTPESLEILLLFSLENQIPILTFSEKYLELGALLSVGTDPFDMGQQAGEMAEKVLNGRDISTIKPGYARKPVVTINEKIARKLKIRVNRDVLPMTDRMK